jgi:hypothetical protein
MKKNAKVRGATHEKPALPCRCGLAHAEENAVLPETTKRHKRQTPMSVSAPDHRNFSIRLFYHSLQKLSMEIKAYVLKKQKKNWLKR